MVGHAVEGRSKMWKGGIMVFFFDQAERWVEEFLEGSRMIWMRYSKWIGHQRWLGWYIHADVARALPRSWNQRFQNVQVALEYSFHFQSSMHVYAYGIDPCCMCPENQSELWLCLNPRSFPMILQENLGGWMRCSADIWVKVNQSIVIWV